MTPEERQRTMDFIVASQANVMVRMDQLVDEHKRFSDDLKRQKETVEALTRVTNDLVTVSKDLVTVSRDLVGRTRKLELRADEVDGFIKFLRELWEASLRRPDNPPQST